MTCGQSRWCNKKEKTEGNAKCTMPRVTWVSTGLVKTTLSVHSPPVCVKQLDVLEVLALDGFMKGYRSLPGPHITWLWSWGHLIGTQAIWGRGHQWREHPCQGLSVPSGRTTVVGGGGAGRATTFLGQGRTVTSWLRTRTICHLRREWEGRRAAETGAGRGVDGLVRRWDRCGPTGH